jgi:hypothetical protein
MLLHPFESLGFDAKAIARIVREGRILFQRKNMMSGLNPKDSAVATATNPRHAQQWLARKPLGDQFRI